MSANFALQTPRTILSPWQPGDWLALRPIAQDREVMRFIDDGRPWTDTRIEHFVQRQMEVFDKLNFCRWKLVIKETGEVAGLCGVSPLENTFEYEMGWWLARAHWGKGLATEAAREALRDAFERVHLPRVAAIAQPENRASLRIMEKLGMKYERAGTYRGVPVQLFAAASPGRSWAQPAALSERGPSD